MSRDPHLKTTRNKDVKEAYAKLAGETVAGLNGKREQKYRHNAILAILSRKFYLAPGTLANILILPEEDDNQLALFETTQNA